MDRLENPVLKRELRIRIRIRRVISAMALRYALLGIMLCLIMLAHLGRGLLAFILAETFVILLFTPGAVCDAFASKLGRGDLRDLTLTRLGSVSILFGKLAGSSLYTCLVVLISAVAMFAVSLFRQNLRVLNLLSANLALLIIIFTSAAISLTFSMLFRRGTFTPAMLTYILTFLLIGSVIIPGPLIKQISDPKAKSIIVEMAMYANPFVMTSRALGKVDIMRTRYMYNLADPIVGRGFTYPNWYAAGILYIGFSSLLLALAFIKFWLARRPADQRAVRVVVPVAARGIRTRLRTLRGCRRADCACHWPAFLDVERALRRRRSGSPKISHLLV